MEPINNLKIRLLSFEHDIDSTRYQQDNLTVIDGVLNLNLTPNFDRSLILRIFSLWSLIQILIFIIYIKRLEIKF